MSELLINFSVEQSMTMRYIVTVKENDTVYLPVRLHYSLNNHKS